MDRVAFHRAGAAVVDGIGHVDSRHVGHIRVVDVDRPEHQPLDLGADLVRHAQRVGERRRAARSDVEPVTIGGLRDLPRDVARDERRRVGGHGEVRRRVQHAVAQRGSMRSVQPCQAREEVGGVPFRQRRRGGVGGRRLPHTQAARTADAKTSATQDRETAAFVNIGGSSLGTCASADARL
ncbi:MAG: hypothetical protein ACXVZ2_14065, partial [Gaiellaceae bacterium]